MMVCVLSLFLVDHAFTAMSGFIAYGWFIGISLALVFIVRKPGQMQACGLGIVAAVVLLGVLTIMEFLNPDFQVIVDKFFADTTAVGEANRAGATYENPNDNGTAIVLGMFVGQFFLPKAMRFVFVLFVGVAIFGTVSRGSLTLWAIAVVISLLFGYLSKGKFFGRFFGLGIVGLLGFLLVTGEIPGLLEEVGLGELLSGDMTIRLSENFFTQNDGSTESRVQAAQETWLLFLDNPLMGIGIGASDFLDSVGTGSHNQHLKIASELGILGVLVYAGLGLIALNTKKLVPLVFVFLYLVIGFTNHGMMEYTVYAILIPAAVIFIPAMQSEDLKRVRKRKKRKKQRSSGEMNLA